MCWFLTVKDHSTGLMAVFAILRKMVNYVAYKLEKYFGLVGYPPIFHTDNGNEFAAKVIIDMLKLINPVTGRPRMPRDKGSIEWSNKTIKWMLLDLLAHRRTNGLDDNWTMVLGLLTENLNSFHGRQTASIPAYNAVFRANYHVIMSCTVDEARNCNTIDKLQKVVMDDDGHINHFVQEHTDQTNDLHLQSVICMRQTV